MITKLRTIFVTAAVAFVLTAPAAFAQTQPGAATSSVLPSGGGQALIDTSDTRCCCSIIKPASFRP